MFPMPGTVIAPTNPNPPPTPTPTDTNTTSIPVVKRAGGSVGLIGRDTDLNKLYVVYGSVRVFENRLNDVGDTVTYWYSWVYLGAESMATSMPTSGSFLVYINGAVTDPVRLRAPVNDVIQHPDGSVTEDHFDTIDRTAGSFLLIQRLSGTPNRWLISPKEYTLTPALNMNPLFLNTF